MTRLSRRYPCGVPRPRLVIAALVLALVPVTAQAQDLPRGGTSASLESTLGTVPARITGSGLLTQARVAHLIAKRAAAITLPTARGEIALDTDGTVLWQHSAARALMPASTMKIITATVALERLGAGWRPRTTVRYDSATSTLTLVGGGDPQLTTAQLRTLAQATVETLTAMSVTPARLTIDDSLFPAPTLQAGVPASEIPTEERPVRALVVDGQRVRDSGLAAGKVFRGLLAAQGLDLPFAGRATFVPAPPSGSDTGTQGTGTQDTSTPSGITQQSGGQQASAQASPGAASAAATDSASATVDTTTARTIASVAGYTLRSTLQRMLLVSDNDIAEMLFRMSSLAAGRSADWADARTTAIETLGTIGIDTSAIHLVDGSGLSRDNRLTATVLAQVLRTDLTRPRTAVLPTLLPTAGRTGTLWYRYTTAPSKCVRGRLHAKTGSLEDVVTLAGYAPAPAGQYRPFAILINGVQQNEFVRWKTRLAIDTVAAAIGGC